MMPQEGLKRHIAKLDTGKFAALATHMESPEDSQLVLSVRPQSKK